MFRGNDFYKRFLLVFVLFLFTLPLSIISGCEKKEAVKSKPQRVSGPCYLSDKFPDDIKKPLDVNFGNKVKLLGITVNKTANNQLGIVYYWQLIDDLGPYDTVFVHFTDKNNNSLFQNDHDFCQRKPFLELKGKFITEPYLINIPESAKGKEIYIKVGFYSLETNMGRIKIFSSGDSIVDEENTRAIIDKIKL